MKYYFTKMQGCGNDFLIYDSMSSEPVELLTSEIQYLCDRHYGPGADGFVVLHDSTEAHAAWKFYNSDGSEAAMCGNAARCCIRYLLEKYFQDYEVIGIQTKAGIIRGRKLETGDIEITLMSKGDMKFEYEPLTIKTDKNVFDGYWIDTGVPHFVLEVKDIATYPINQVGKLLVQHEAFSGKGSNITFFQGLMGPRIRSCTFERGVEAQTLACGTGVAAAAILYSELYLQQFPVEVSVPGGDLIVDLSPVSKMLVLQGPADYVATIELEEIPHNFERPQYYGDRKKA